MRRKWSHIGHTNFWLAAGNCGTVFLLAGRGGHGQFALGIDRGFVNPEGKAHGQSRGQGCHLLRHGHPFGKLRAGFGRDRSREKV